MNPEAEIVEKFVQLSPEAKEFLSKIDNNDIELIRDGLELVQSMRTVSYFMKWLILCILGIFFSTIMLWEAILKAIKLWRGVA